MRVRLFCSPLREAYESVGLAAILWATDLIYVMSFYDIFTRRIAFNCLLLLITLISCRCDMDMRLHMSLRLMPDSSIAPIARQRVSFISIRYSMRAWMSVICSASTSLYDRPCGSLSPIILLTSGSTRCFLPLAIASTYIHASSQ